MKLPHSPTVSSVQLRNFRGFRDHTVSLDKNSVLVGQNNAGKSTFIDALRLLAIASNRVAAATYQAAPAWLDGEASGMGFRVNFQTIDFDFRNVTTNLRDDQPAKLQLVYSNRARLTLWLGSGASENFAQLSTPTLGIIKSKAEAASVSVCSVIVMPPLGALNPRETMIAKDRVAEFLYGRLSSWHFRNQLNEFPDRYKEWALVLEETWPGIQVKSFTNDGGESGKELSLIVREGPFASEVAWVGSGLQAWMQILWFVCRAKRDALVVLDEPDVFLHAGMQRKIAKLVLSGGFKQAAIATHSSEIISDVEPTCITVVRKRERSSWKPGRKAELQKVVDDFGSRHNLQLSKLASARKIALFEGEDQKFFLEASLKISSNAYYKFSAIPSFDIQGVDNWHQAIGAAKALYAASEGSMPVHLFIDRDFRSDDEVSAIQADCAKANLDLTCWSRKEIENYLVNSAPIARFVRQKRSHVTDEDIERMMEDTARSLVDYTVRAIADRWQRQNKGASVSKAMSEAELIFESFTKTRKISEIVPGKRLISELSKRSKAEWNSSFAPMTLCRIHTLDEFPAEFRDALGILLQ